MDNLQVVQNLRNEIKQLKADRLELAEAVIYSGNKVFSYQLSKATPNQCVDFVANSINKVFLKAEKITKESK